jgi:hypothetical protein
MHFVKDGNVMVQSKCLGNRDDLVGIQSDLFLWRLRRNTRLYGLLLNQEISLVLPLIEELRVKAEEFACWKIYIYIYIYIGSSTLSLRTHLLDGLLLLINYQLEIDWFNGALCILQGLSC